MAGVAANPSTDVRLNPALAQSMGIYVPSPGPVPTPNSMPGQQYSYAPGSSTLLPSTYSEAGLSAAQDAVTGINKAAGGPYTTGGAGSSYTVGPNGVDYTTTPNLIPQETASQSQLSAQSSKQAEEETAQKAALAQKAFNDRLTAITGSGGSVAPPEVTGSNVNFDEQAARDAAFARAKDQAGQTANATLKAIQGLSEETGQMGSSMEASRIGGAIGGAATNVNDYTRERYIQDLSRASQIADRNYQGGITQRGQDIQAQQALYGLLSSIGTLY